MSDDLDDEAARVDAAVPEMAASFDRVLEMRQREAVVAEVLEWVGTRYQNGARIKGACADCTFISVVYENAGVVPHVEIGPYSPQAHLHRAAAAYHDIVARHGAPVAEADALPGDLVLYWVGRAFSHSGIIVPPGWPHIVHASQPDRCVLPAMGDQGMLARFERKFFTLWPKEEKADGTPGR